VEPPAENVFGGSSERTEPKSTSGLESLNVGGLQPLGTADNLEFNGLTLIERAIAVRHDSGEVDENVLTSLALDETKALAGVEPLDCTLFFHRCFLFKKIKLSDALFSGNHLRGRPGVFR